MSCSPHSEKNRQFRAAWQMFSLIHTANVYTETDLTLAFCALSLLPSIPPLPKDLHAVAGLGELFVMGVVLFLFFFPPKVRVFRNYLEVLQPLESSRTGILSHSALQTQSLRALAGIALLCIGPVPQGLYYYLHNEQHCTWNLLYFRHVLCVCHQYDIACVSAVWKTAVKEPVGCNRKTWGGKGLKLFMLNHWNNAWS